MRRRTFSLATAVAVAAFCAQAPALAQTGPTDPYLGMEGRIFNAGNGFTMPYRLARPPAYSATTKYPLVVFLHGSGESGVDNRLQISKNIGVPTGGSVFTQPQNQAKYPTFFIAPQTPTIPIGWTAGSAPEMAVMPLIAALEAEFSIDHTRIYLTGLSVGGDGTWLLIEQNPTFFAAAIPMSGGGDTTQAPMIAHIPIWDFHGSADPAKPVTLSRTMIAALEAAGGHPRYTEYPGAGHVIWDMAYQTPDLLPWMNAQQLGVPDPYAPDSGIYPLPEAGAGDASPTHDAASSAEASADAATDDAGSGGSGTSTGASGSAAGGSGATSGGLGASGTAASGSGAGGSGTTVGAVGTGTTGGGCDLASSQSSPGFAWPALVGLLVLAGTRRRMCR